MRIIGGKYRGKKLLTFEGKNIRPTGERAREALFNILYSRLGSLEGYKILDVFAGTGAFGLEALSRGASKVCFLDKNTQLLSKNIALFPDEKNKIAVISTDATVPPKARETFGLLFMDAPYAKGLSEKSALGLADKGWLQKGAICLIETQRDEALSLDERFHKEDERFYGQAKISFYVYNS